MKFDYLFLGPYENSDSESDQVATIGITGYKTIIDEMHKKLISGSMAGELEWLEGLINEAEKGHKSDLGDIELIEAFTAGTLLPSDGTATVVVAEKVKGVAPLGYDEAPADFTLTFRGEQTPHMNWNISARDLEYSLENLKTMLRCLVHSLNPLILYLCNDYCQPYLKP